MKLYANRYKHLNVLGSGAFGRVLLVEDIQNQKKFAFKLLVQQSSQAIQSLKNEFSILQSLSHEHLAQVFEMGQITENNQTQLYLVSEFIEGENILSWSKSASVPNIDASFLQCLHTLDFLHQHQIYHSDLKPQNILVQSHNDLPKIKIIDFGLAHEIHSKNQTHGGTFTYMAPEMLKGKSANAQTDIYALGVLFYKIFTHNFPELGHTLIPPSAWNPKLGKQYDFILTKMLFHAPEDRYQSIKQILEDWILLYDSMELKKLNSQNAQAVKPFFLREQEKTTFLNWYQDRILSDHKKFSPVFLVSGEKGIGKSHFLRDVIKHANLDLVQAIEWNDWQKKNSFETLPEKALIYGNQIELDDESIYYLNTFFLDSNHLFIFSATQSNINLPIANQISLKRFSQNDILLFLQNAIGQTNIPHKFVLAVEKHSQGLPLAVQNIIDLLLQKNFFRSETGNWSEKVLHDLENHLALESSKARISTTPNATPAFDEKEIKEQLAVKDRALNSEDLFLFAKLKRKSNQPTAALLILNFIMEQKPADPNLFIQCTLELCEIHIEQNELSLAHTLLTSITSTDKITTQDRIRALELTGLCEFRSNKLTEACNTFESALQILNQLPTPHISLTVAIYSRLSLVKWRLGEKDVAENLNSTAWQLFKTKLSPSEKLATVRLNIDEIYYQKGMYAQALECLNEYYQLLAPEPYREAYPITLYKMARVHLKMKDWSLAEFKLNLCLQEFKSRNSTQWLSHVYNELGILAKKRGNLTEALQNYQHAFDLQRLFKKDVSLFLIAVNLGNLHLLNACFAEAEKYFLYAHKNLISLSPTSLTHQGLLGCTLGLAEIQLHSKNAELAHAWLSRAFEQLQLDLKAPEWQTYWQHQASWAQLTLNATQLELALKTLTKLQQNKNFDHENFLAWQKDHFDKNLKL